MENSADEIEQEQLEEYKEMVEDLGAFPDKVKINSLSMVAEDHADSPKSALAIYNVIRDPLLSPSVHFDRKLPLVYVIDSILKNVKGEFVPIIEDDAKNWMPVVYNSLPDDKRAKLKKVWNLWKDKHVFSSLSKWEEMGKCFSGTNGETGDKDSRSVLEKAGISFGKDGGLVLMPSLRNAMQAILDDLQSDEQDELNKVSLERLAVIDHDLLIKIKRTAEDSLHDGTANGSGAGDSASSSKVNDELSFLVETRSNDIVQRSNSWVTASVNYLKDTRDIIASLNHLVRESSSIDKRYSQTEALRTTGALATAAVTASLLTNSLEQLKNVEDDSKRKKTSTSLMTRKVGMGASETAHRSFFTVDKSLFTNDGLKKLNEAFIGLLYEIGLPFVSSGDGRRFATQLELSQHLDALFKKSQLEKTMATTQERGWYDDDNIWCKDHSFQELTQSLVGPEGHETADGLAMEDEDADPVAYTVPADESRDHCVVCGINFKMFFDNDDGIYKYSNAREIEIMNDEVSLHALDQVLVHMTCWRNLGSPQTLTTDQTIM